MLAAPSWLYLEGQPRLAFCTSVHPSYSGNISDPSVGTSAFQVAVLRGFLALGKVESKLSVSALMWSAKIGIPKTS
jgi:hypothetical protein